jgi:soluble lytic murein transglycosylase-like protein
VNPRNVDIGIMQINWLWHGKNVPSIERLFDPDFNIAYAAAYLASLSQEHGRLAIGYYHSFTPRLYESYIQRVALRYEEISGSPLAPVHGCRDSVCRP